MSKPRQQSADRELQRKWYAMFRQIAWRRGYNPRWADWAFKARFGSEPGRFSSKMLEPTEGVLLWVRDWEIRRRAEAQRQEEIAIDTVREHRAGRGAA